jgi:hypothetical protein
MRREKAHQRRQRSGLMPPSRWIGLFLDEAAGGPDLPDTLVVRWGRTTRKYICSAGPLMLDLKNAGNASNSPGCSQSATYEPLSRLHSRIFEGRCTDPQGVPDMRRGGDFCGFYCRNCAPFHPLDAFNADRFFHSATERACQNQSAGLTCERSGREAKLFQRN